MEYVKLRVCSTSSEELSQETTSPDGSSTQALKLVLEKLEQMGSKLLELQSELTEQRQEAKRNQASNEKIFTDFANDVARNISLLQDQSMLILAKQSACTSDQEQLSEISFISTANEGVELGELQEDTSTSFTSAEDESSTPVTTSTTPGTTPTKAAPPSTTSRTTPSTPSTTTAPPSATTTTTLKPQVPSYSSCRNVPSNVSGVYRISVHNDSVPIYVYCEQEKFGGGWIVIQHRFDGSVDFYRNWEEYRNGFGELDKEFWFGLEQIHQITSARNHELMVEIRDFRGNYGYARYSLFQVGNEKEQYHLKKLGLYKGIAGDALGYSRVTKFSTKDRDNDGSSERHYAVHNEGAWWYGFNGSSSNLNGRYMDGFNEKSNWWNYYKNFYLGLKFTRMMIRELQE
ncbi:ficolin-2-like [Anopheles aquasalis]|uniref:ficolin-2-like n=1 Tax=Anopheles aquasalis TaxID=42839 RepID=UPI00215A71FF|nr:ficolin-2-like [Anopheles aquasalis]